MFFLRIKMPKKATAKKKVVKKPVKKPVTRRGVQRPHFKMMMVDEKTKMNEMLKAMLARGPGLGTTVLGHGSTELERKANDQINENHNLRLDVNRTRDDLDRYRREKKDLQQQKTDISRQKKEFDNQLKDQTQRQKLESQSYW